MRTPHFGGFTNPTVALERLAFEKFFPNQSLPSELADTDDPYNESVFDKIKQTARDPFGRKQAAAAAEARARYARADALQKAADVESKDAEKAAAALKAKAASDALTKRKAETLPRVDAAGIRWEGGLRRSPVRSSPDRRIHGRWARERCFATAPSSTCRTTG
jgi:hypothetical protein